MTKYALKTDDKGSKALDIQQAMIGDVTREEIKKAGLKKGMQVWEYGCGNGAVTLDLAEIVGSQGHIIAIDQSAEQIKRVLGKAKENHLSNITAKVEDIHTFTPSLHAADFVFGRYILMHLKNPEEVLMKIKSPLLKEGGIACFAESCWEETEIEGPFSKEINAFGASVIKLGQTLGADYNFGRKLKTCMSSLGFKNVRETKRVFSFESQLFGELWSIRLSEVGDQLVRSGCATRVDIDKWVEIAKIISDHSETTRMHTPLYFVSGKS